MGFWDREEKYHSWREAHVQEAYITAWSYLQHDSYEGVWDPVCETPDLTYCYIYILHFDNSKYPIVGFNQYTHHYVPN